MKDETLSFKELIFAIQAMRKQANFLIGKGKSYDKLLAILLTKDYYNDDETHYFSSKELQELTRLPHQKIKKQMEQIHKDVFDRAFDDPDLFNFQSIIYDFYVKGWRNSIGFKGRIPVLPRVGDDFDLPFLRAFDNGRGHFYVSRIQHQFTDTTQIISIWLEAGIYNSYAKFKEDKDKYEEHERWLKRIKTEQY